MQTTADMIIEVQQQLQKQGSAKTRKLLDQEIIWALNKAQLKFRDSKLRRKADNSGAYEIDQMHADALRIWTKEMVSLTLTSTPKYSTGARPTDYAYLLNDATDVIDCKGEQTIPVLVPNRLTSHAVIREIQFTPYYRTKSSSPLSTLNSEGLRVFNDENFTVKAIYIDYIRKAREISLSLSCELPAEFWQEVCDITVELLLVDLQAPNAQLKIQQNQVI